MSNYAEELAQAVIDLLEADNSFTGIPVHMWGNMEESVIEEYILVKAMHSEDYSDFAELPIVELAVAAVTYIGDDLSKDNHSELVGKLNTFMRGLRTNPSSIVVDDYIVHGVIFSSTDLDLGTSDNRMKTRIISKCYLSDEVTS